MKPEIEKDIEVKIEDWDFRVSANKNSISFYPYSGGEYAPSVSIEDIPALCDLLRQIHLDLTNGLTERFELGA
ncbi:MAG: hypothetical protein KF855_03205 [Acidobacteria bacterium]|nr:hypothetical protein [Acidobacteriota bacterium]